MTANMFEKTKVNLTLALSLLGWLCLLGTVARAQSTPTLPAAGLGEEPMEEVTPTPTPLPAPTASTSTLKLLQALEAAHGDVKTIHATFKQTREDELFTETTESDGELWFDRPHHFRGEYSAPQPMTTLIDDDALLIYFSELNQVDRWAFSSPEERDQQLHQFLLGFGFKAHDLVERYEIHSSDDDAQLAEQLKSEARANKWDAGKVALLHIVPRGAFQEACPFTQMDLYVDLETMRPKQVSYRDLSDSVVTLTMKKIEINPALDDSLFDRRKIFPSDAEVVDKRD